MPSFGPVRPASPGIQSAQLARYSESDPFAAMLSSLSMAARTAFNSSTFVLSMLFDTMLSVRPAAALLVALAASASASRSAIATFMRGSLAGTF